MVRIVANPRILGGKPIVEGTRLSVEHILGLLASGMSHTEIIEDYPLLTEESIRAVLAYAAKALRNKIVIDVVSSRDGVS
ncbi:antitoxin [Candidatus Poribacteria bacterium]|nr:MAG: antitoxin [Candidatus Poribacteria bacterium]